MAVPGNTQVAAGSQPFRSAQDFINICNTTASRVMCIDRVFFSLADAIDWACQNGLFRSKLPATAGDVVNKYYDEIKDGLIGSVVETWGHEDNIWAQAALDRSNPRIRYHEEFFEKHGRLLDQQHPDDKVARYRILISPVIMLLHIRFQILGHRILDGCYANMPPTRDPSVRPETVYLQGFTPFPLDPMDGDERGEVMWLVGFFADMALEDLFYGVFDMREPLSSHSGHPNLPFTAARPFARIRDRETMKFFDKGFWISDAWIAQLFDDKNWNNPYKKADGQSPQIDYWEWEAEDTRIVGQLSHARSYLLPYESS